LSIWTTLLAAGREMTVVTERVDRLRNEVDTLHQAVSSNTDRLIAVRSPYLRRDFKQFKTTLLSSNSRQYRSNPLFITHAPYITETYLDNRTPFAVTLMYVVLYMLWAQNLFALPTVWLTRLQTMTTGPTSLAINPRPITAGLRA
jgi:hypothetical protein